MYILCVILVILMFCNSAFCSSHFKKDNYIGSNLKVIHTNYKKGYGDNILTHNLPQVGMFAGIRLNNYIFLEAGYDSSIKRKRFNTLGNGDMVCATPIHPLISPVNFIGSIKIKGPYFDVIGYRSISDNKSFLFSLGFSFLKAKAQRNANCICYEFNGSNRQLTGDKLVARVSTGLQYNISDDIDLRVTVGFMNTSRLKLYGSDRKCSRYLPEIRPRDTLNLNLGLIWLYE